MRELSADRPDKTESPHTVDAGHFQLEMDLVSYVSDHYRRGGENTRSEAWSAAPMNLKLGLLNDTDFQLMLEPYSEVREHDRANGTSEHHSGFGDLTFRLKKNLWGNDRGATALALMPFLKLPTNEDHLGNHSVEGGLIIPFGLELPYGWELGTTTAAAGVRNQDDSGYQAAFAQSVTLGHDLTQRLAGYAEFFAEIGTDNGSDWVGTVDLGLTYSVTSDLQLDAGVNVGVTEAADDVNPFVGLTWRY